MFIYAKMHGNSVKTREEKERRGVSKKSKGPWISWGWHLTFSAGQTLFMFWPFVKQEKRFKGLFFVLFMKSALTAHTFPKKNRVRKRERARKSEHGESCGINRIWNEEKGRSANCKDDFKVVVV